MTRPPWRDHDGPVAAAISAAFDRLNAAHGLDSPSTHAVQWLADDSRALAFGGLDADPAEVQEMTGALSRNINAHIEHRTLQRVEETPAPEPADLQEIARACIAGGLTVALLAGALYGAEHERQVGTSKPLPPSYEERPEWLPEGIAMSAPVPSIADAIGRRPTDAERAELARDSVQWVLDMECDRLERTAMALTALGLERPARLLTHAAADLRRELEGGGE